MKYDGSLNDFYTSYVANAHRGWAILIDYTQERISIILSVPKKKRSFHTTRCSMSGTWYTTKPNMPRFE